MGHMCHHIRLSSIPDLKGHLIAFKEGDQHDLQHIICNKRGNKLESTRLNCLDNSTSKELEN